MNTNASLRRGFTAVEMLGALLLTTVLMLAVLAALTGIGRTRREIASQDARVSWPDELTTVLRFDLLHARQVTSAGDPVTFEGYCALDPATKLPLHRPARVTYRVAAVAGRSWLVREQLLLDLPSNTPPTSDLLCADVQSVKLIDAKLPTRARVVLRHASAHATSFDRVLILQ